MFKGKSNTTTYLKTFLPQLRLCLVRVKSFPERKTFSCVWQSQNSFYGKLILVFDSFHHFTRKCIKSGKTLVRRATLVDRRETSAIVLRAVRRRGAIVGRAARLSIAPLVGAIVPLSL